MKHDAELRDIPVIYPARLLVRLLTLLFLCPSIASEVHYCCGDQNTLGNRHFQSYSFGPALSPVKCVPHKSGGLEAYRKDRRALTRHFASQISTRRFRALPEAATTLQRKRYSVAQASMAPERTIGRQAGLPMSTSTIRDPLIAAGTTHSQ